MVKTCTAWHTSLENRKCYYRLWKWENSPTWWLFFRSLVFWSVGKYQRNDQGTFAKAMQFIVPTYLFFSFDTPTPPHPQLDGTTAFYMVMTEDSFDSKFLLLDIITILKQRLFFHSFSVSFIRWECREKFPMILFKSI